MEKLLDKDSIPFQTEGRLLQELGLRLVANPEVALVELIKNAYDADAASSSVRLVAEGETLVVVDNGHGMTVEDFKLKWMRIATSSKANQDLSPKYGRRLTGAKGIGRFAVRYLGDHLTLESVAYDLHHQCKTRLTAVFDWPKLDAAIDISLAVVDYSLVEAGDTATLGTTLTIGKLRSGIDFTETTTLRDSVVRIVSPLQGLESGRFANTNISQGKDPGFKIILPGEDEDDDVNLAKLILDNNWGRLTIELTGKNLRFRVWLPDLKKPKTLALRVNSQITKGFLADIRFFPKRAGVFRGKGINGREAWSWVRDNVGVKVVDHGFHIHPYGFPDDDWLRLNRDKAHSRRDWETAIAKKYFPISSARRNDPQSNPMLYLPYNYQLVGAVFIETRRKFENGDVDDLIPAMDREGLLENKAFHQFWRFIRAGIEFLAHEDKAELERKAIADASQAAKTARAEIAQAIKFIENSPTLTPADKARVVTQYRRLADKLDEQEEYSAQARRSMITMSLLGVVAGFMTHESKAVVEDLEQAVEQVRKLAKKHPEMADISKDLTDRLNKFQGYLDYSRLFVQNVRVPKEVGMSTAGQVRHILNRFKGFAEERKIEIVNEVSADVRSPPLPVTVYSGVLLNLYTNALKAVVAVQASIKKPKIVFRAWNEPGKHVVEVSDNGVGIPPEIRSRIWEPLYTTTSDVGNPLGSGMGLGLTLVRQVLAEFGGTIVIVDDAPAGFSTCFRVTFPNKTPSI